MTTFENNQAAKAQFCDTTKSGKESADNYRAVIAMLNTRWRVILCRDGIQWILQRRDGERGGGARWTGRSYCRARASLLRACRTHAGEIDPIALTTLHNLPDRMGGTHV